MATWQVSLVAQGERIRPGCRAGTGPIRPHPQCWVRLIDPPISPCAKPHSMNRHLTPTEFARLDASAITLSMLDGYLAASASGPNFAMPDQVLRWASETAPGDTCPDSQIVMHEQTVNDLIIWLYQAVNDALNDQTYVPHLADHQAWFQGYLEGFAADMTAWAPLTAARPELLKVILAGACTDLADAARWIHGFWVERRRTGADGGALQGLLAALSPTPMAATRLRLH